MIPMPKNNLSAQRQRGLSLIELMISLTIGLILLFGITTLIVQQNSSRDELEKSSRQIENGRYATQLLRDDIQHAGYYGEFVPANTVIPGITDPCAITVGWATTPTYPVPIYGYPGAAADPTAATSCNALGGLPNYRANTPVLIVRRAETASIIPTTTPPTPGTTYFQASLCNTSNVPFVIGTTGFTLQNKDCATTAPLRRYLVNIYYLSNCNNCNPSDNRPTLKVAQLGPTATLQVTPLVEGIENIRYDYGIDNSSTGYPDTYTATPTAAQWPNVVAVRVSLLSRNLDCSTGYKDTSPSGTKTYDLGGGPFSADAGDAAACGGNSNGYRRHVFTELVRIINISGRRALQ